VRPGCERLERCPPPRGAAPPRLQQGLPRFPIAHVQQAFAELDLDHGVVGPGGKGKPEEIGGGGVLAIQRHHPGQGDDGVTALWRRRASLGEQLARPGAVVASHMEVAKADPQDGGVGHQREPGLQHLAGLVEAAGFAELVAKLEKGLAERRAPRDGGAQLVERLVPPSDRRKGPGEIGLRRRVVAAPGGALQGIDRLGRTPLHQARRSKDLGREEIVRVRREDGGGEPLGNVGALRPQAASRKVERLGIGARRLAGWILASHTRMLAAPANPLYSRSQQTSLRGDRIVRAGPPVEPKRRQDQSARERQSMSTLENRPNAALLVVDVQTGVVAGAHERDAVVANIVSLVDTARRQGAPVVWVQHFSGELPRGSERWRIAPELAPAKGEPLVEKAYGDAFEETSLEALLSDLRVGRLVVAGAQTDACIRSTLHGALVRGYDVTLVGDAHTTEDLSKWGAPPPGQVIAHTNLYWKFQTAPGRTAGTVKTKDVDFGGGESSGG
jgi:isochorismate hydrolase